MNGQTREPESFSTRKSGQTWADARVGRGAGKDSTGARAPKAAARVSPRSLARTRVFRLASVLLSLCVLAGPAAALVPKGQKNYKQGLQFEAAQQWEKAAEEFSLAVAAEPSNSEYQLHYRRAVFNASQAFMQQGGSLLDRGDYVGAYNAFRRAYAYDPANELAASMMDRAFKLQTNKDEDAKPERHAPAAAAAARLQPTVYTPASRAQDDAGVAPRGEQLHAIQYGGDLEQFVKYLARQLKLNVVFDRDFPKRNVSVDLQDVTAAQALDYIFLTQGLFFQKLSNRTIVVAEQVKRPQYQQLVLRTFYLYNVDPNDARQLITASIPPQAGRQPVITANKATNSITVRDTPENVRLVGELLRGIDKERAEVVMDVNIYEVSREDLMQFGNQIGTSDTLGNLGGIQKGLSVVGGSRQVVAQALSAVPTALGAAFLVPPTSLSALQRRDNTRLVASTQVHAFDGEKSTAHIGQRVPVQTATVAPYGSVSTGEGNNAQAGVAQGLFGGNGYPVIQYEKTGLTLEFTPQVFPDLDVQVKMSIKSNDVTTQQGTAALTPTFTERNIEGIARIQNNRTMMIASVAQNSQSRGRQGLPVLGLVPVLGRLFSAPRREDSQTDIVIAVTPHVMRAPSVTPRDEEMHPSGTLQTPTSDTLEAMLEEVAREEQLAAARSIPTHRSIELPDAAAEQASSKAARHAASVAPSATGEQPAAETPTYIPAPRALMDSVPEAQTRPAPRDVSYDLPPDAKRPEAQPAEAFARQDATPTRAETPSSAPANSASQNAAGSNSLFALRPAAAAAATTSAPAVESARTRARVVNPEPAPAGPPASYAAEKNAAERSAEQPTSAAAFRLMADQQPLRVGETRELKLLVKTDAPLGIVAVMLRFDTRALAVRSVRAGNLFKPADAQLTHTATPRGLLLVTVSSKDSPLPVSGAGVLLTLEVEALENYSGPFKFDADDVNVVAIDGRKVLVKVID
ncbi:MAG TPA: secretin N-terminal domain-containing protein [Pyrinomonadaceae bacterium]|nr:secretin N-terminal domain-containing protein [Pyrinomonadaceae bacterium]